MLTSKCFADAITLLGTRFPQIQEPALQAVYLEYLRDLDDAEFWPAVKQAAGEHEFLPTAKQLRLLARPEVAAKVEAGEAFTRILADPEVKRYDPRTGTSYSLTAIATKYGDAAWRAVIAIGGSRALSGVTEANEPFVRKEFREAFEGYAAELASRTTGARLGAPSDRPRVGPGTRTLRIERAGGVIDRVLPPGDRP